MTIFQLILKKVSKVLGYVQNSMLKFYFNPFVLACVTLVCISVSSSLTTNPNANDGLTKYERKRNYYYKYQ